MTLPPSMNVNRVYAHWLAHFGIWGLVAVMLIPAILAGGFWWTDETRHAMGGVFILDFVKDMPISDPMGYAMRYFAQYPALALNWYLPGFYAVEATFYALFGISESVAHWTVIFFCLLAGSAWLMWCKRSWGLPSAVLSAALFLTVPLWNFWGRSVMLEAPAIAMFLLSLVFFERYLERPELGRGVQAGLVLAAALLFKQTLALLLPAVLIYGLMTPRRAALWRPAALPAYLCVIIALALIALHAVKFGNLGLTATLGDIRSETGHHASRLSLERWLAYPKLLFGTWGWPLLAMSLLGALLPSRDKEQQLPMLYAWIGVWYVFMTLVMGPANGARYTLYAFPALAAFAARPVYIFRDNKSLRHLVMAALVGAIGLNGFRSLNQTVPYVDGYREVAEFIKTKGTSGPIMFAGKHDGSFVFHMRRLDPERNEVILRADKLLVSLAVHKYFGMQSHVSNLAEVSALLEKYNVEYVLIERPDIVDVKEFDMLHAAVQRPPYVRLHTEVITSSANAEAPESVEIYRNDAYKVNDDATIVIPLPHMGREIRFKRSDIH